MDVKHMLEDPIAFADLILAKYVQGSKGAETFLTYITDNLPMAQKARNVKRISAAQAKPEEIRSEAGKPMQIVKRKKAKKAFSFDFLRRLIPVGIGVGGFVIGFFIVMPLMSVFVVPIFGFFAACGVTIGGIWYANEWKKGNLEEDEPEEAPGKKNLSL